MWEGGKNSVYRQRVVDHERDREREKVRECGEGR